MIDRIDKDRQRIIDQNKTLTNQLIKRMIDNLSFFKSKKVKLKLEKVNIDHNNFQYWILNKVQNLKLLKDREHNTLLETIKTFLRYMAYPQNNIDKIINIYKNH